MSFIISNLNTGNVTQQRLQGNQNAQDISGLQSQVGSITAQNTHAIPAETVANGAQVLIQTAVAVASGTVPVATPQGFNAPQGVLITADASSGGTLNFRVSNLTGSSYSFPGCTMLYKFV